jgi:hypothetical protein
MMKSSEVSVEDSKCLEEEILKSFVLIPQINGLLHCQLHTNGIMMGKNRRQELNDLYAHDFYMVKDDDNDRHDGDNYDGDDMSDQNVQYDEDKKNHLLSFHTEHYLTSDKYTSKREYASIPSSRMIPSANSDQHADSTKEGTESLNEIDTSALLAQEEMSLRTKSSSFRSNNHNSVEEPALVDPNSNTDTTLNPIPNLYPDAHSILLSDSNVASSSVNHNPMESEALTNVQLEADTDPNKSSRRLSSVMTDDIITVDHDRNTASVVTKHTVIDGNDLYYLRNMDEASALVRSFLAYNRTFSQQSTTR